MSKIALVTGAGKRVGRTLAMELAAAGYDLAVHYRRSAAEAQAVAAEIRALGRTAVAFGADLADEAESAALFDAVLARFGRLDAVVCSASTWLRKSLETTTVADLHAEFAGNAVSTFRCCQLGGLAMCGQAAGGAIVAIGDWAYARPYLDHAAYFAAKGAIPALVRTFARELGERNPNVRVNGVLPGPVLSGLGSGPEVAARDRELTLVRRADEPQWLAHAVRFLLENPFVTGVCVPVDGGRTIYSPGDD